MPTTLYINRLDAGTTTETFNIYFPHDIEWSATLTGYNSGSTESPVRHWARFRIIDPNEQVVVNEGTNDATINPSGTITNAMVGEWTVELEFEHSENKGSGQVKYYDWEVAYQATANAEVVDASTPAISVRGFVFGRTSKGNPGNVEPGNSGYERYVSESGQFGIGDYDLTIFPLKSGETYYVRAFVYNPAGYVYGNEVSFEAVVEDGETYLARGTVDIQTTVTGRSMVDIFSRGLVTVTTIASADGIVSEHISGTAVVSGSGAITVVGKSLDVVEGFAAVSASGTALISGQKHVVNTVLITTGGQVRARGDSREIVTSIIQVSGGGQVVATGTKGALERASISGSGDVAVAVATGRVSAPIWVDSGGQVAATGTKRVLEQASISGSGDVAVVVATGRVFTPIWVDSGGHIKASTRKNTSLDVLITTSGLVKSSGVKRVAESVNICGYGSVVVVTSALEQTFGSIVIVGGGSVLCDGQKSISRVISISGYPNILLNSLKSTSGRVYVSGRGDVVIVGLPRDTLYGLASVSGGGMVVTDGRHDFVGEIKLSTSGRVESGGVKSSLSFVDVTGNGHLILEPITARFGDTRVFGQGQCLVLISKDCLKEVWVSGVTSLSIDSIAAERVFRIETTQEDFLKGELSRVVALEDGTVRLSIMS